MTPTEQQLLAEMQYVKKELQELKDYFHVGQKPPKTMETINEEARKAVEGRTK